jgi:hypothetical protein
VFNKQGAIKSEEEIQKERKQERMEEEKERNTEKSNEDSFGVTQSNRRDAAV